MQVSIINITPENVEELGIFCIKDKKNPGRNKKKEWFLKQYPSGLRLKIAVDENGKQLGFIEYIPSENAWRPIKANGFLFIQCIGLFVSKAKGKGIGSTLIKECEKEAKISGKVGTCVMTSKGAWMANNTLFTKNEYIIADQKGRFELLTKSFKINSQSPCFLDWTKNQKRYKGWNIVYSDQCPWHEKSVSDLTQSAINHNIKLKVHKINSPIEAQQSPSGFGTFSLIKDGKILADHYISKTRFQNILKKEYPSIQ